MTKHEIIEQFREVTENITAFNAAMMIRGQKGLTPSNWHGFRAVVRRANEVLEKIDGPKAKGSK